MLVSIPHRKGTTTEISLAEYYCNTIVTTLQQFLPRKARRPLAFFCSSRSTLSREFSPFPGFFFHFPNFIQKVDGLFCHFFCSKVCKRRVFVLSFSIFTSCKHLYHSTLRRSTDFFPLQFFHNFLSISMQFFI